MNSHLCFGGCCASQVFRRGRRGGAGGWGGAEARRLIRPVGAGGGGGQCIGLAVGRATSRPARGLLQRGRAPAGALTRPHTLRQARRPSEVAGHGLANVDAERLGEPGGWGCPFAEHSIQHIRTHAWGVQLPRGEQWGGSMSQHTKCALSGLLDALVILWGTWGLAVCFGTYQNHRALTCREPLKNLLLQMCLPKQPYQVQRAKTVSLLAGLLALRSEQRMSGVFWFGLLSLRTLPHRRERLERAAPSPAAAAAAATSATLGWQACSSVRGCLGACWPGNCWQAAAARKGRGRQEGKAQTGTGGCATCVCHAQSC